MPNYCRRRRLPAGGGAAELQDKLRQITSEIQQKEQKLGHEMRNLHDLDESEPPENDASKSRWSEKVQQVRRCIKNQDERVESLYRCRDRLQAALESAQGAAQCQLAEEGEQSAVAHSERHSPANGSGDGEHQCGNHHHPDRDRCQKHAYPGCREPGDSATPSRSGSDAQATPSEPRPATTHQVEDACPRDHRTCELRCIDPDIERTDPAMAGMLLRPDVPQLTSARWARTMSLGRATGEAPNWWSRRSGPLLDSMSVVAMLLFDSSIAYQNAVDAWPDSDVGGV